MLDQYRQRIMNAFENTYPTIMKTMTDLCHHHFMSLKELHERDLLMPNNPKAEGVYCAEDNQVQILVLNPYQEVDERRLLVIRSVLELIGAAHPLTLDQAVRSHHQPYSHYAFVQSLHLLANLCQLDEQRQGISLKQAFEYIHNIAISLSHFLHIRQMSSIDLEAVIEKYCRLLDFCISANIAMITARKTGMADHTQVIDSLTEERKQALDLKPSSVIPFRRKASKKKEPEILSIEDFNLETLENGKKSKKCHLD